MDISSYYYYLIWHLRAKIVTHRNIARLALVTILLAIRAPIAGAADPVYFSADQIDAVALLGAHPPPDRTLTGATLRLSLPGSTLRIPMAPWRALWATRP